MNGIPVEYKNETVMAFFYVNGINGPIVFWPRFQEKNSKKKFNDKLLKSVLETVDYAETIIEEPNRYDIVQWWSESKLRQAIARFGTIKRVMRVKIIEPSLVKYEFHILGDFPN